MKKIQLKYHLLCVMFVQLMLATIAFGQVVPLALSVDPNKLSDPTKPPDFMLARPLGKKMGPLQLSGIYIFPNYRIAIINNLPVMLGNQIGSFTITAITPYTVELSDRSNNKIILEMITPIKIRRE